MDCYTLVYSSVAVHGYWKENLKGLTIMYSEGGSRIMEVVYLKYLKLCINFVPSIPDHEVLYCIKNPDILK